MQIEYRDKYEFKAGRFSYDPATKKVLPLKAKGLIRITDDMNAEKIFSWINLDTNIQQINLMVCSNDARFTVSKNNSLLLSFDSFEDKYFFWLQVSIYYKQDKELKANEVAERVQKIIDYQQEQLSNELEVKEPQPHSNEKQEVKIPPQIQPTITPTFKIDQSFIQRMQKNLFQKRPNQIPIKPIHLTEIINNDFLKFANENFSESFLEFLPQDQKQKAQFRDNIYSPQFQQAIEVLDDALNSQSGISLFYEMRLDTNFLEKHYGTEAFLRALQKWGSEQNHKQKQQQSHDKQKKQ